MNETQIKLMVTQLLVDMQNRFHVESEEIKSLTEKQFGALVQSLNDLNDLTNRYYEMDQEGNYPVMDNAALIEFERQYSATIKCCNDFSQTLENAGAKGLEMNQLVKKVSDALQTDISSIMNIDVRTEKSLPEALSEARMKVIEYDPYNLSTAGNNLSKRGLVEIPTSEGGSIKGFFTNDVQFDVVKSINKHLESLKASNVENKDILVPIVEKIRENEKYANKLFPYASNKEWTQQDFEDMGYSKERAKELLESKSVKEGLDRLTEDIGKGVEGSELFYHFSGHGYRSYISKRNVGMSRMADMLGMPNILGRAENVKLKKNSVDLFTGEKTDEISTGVFMENVPGVDPYHMSFDDPVLSYGLEVFDTPQALENLADLQLLDYVCGNIDRHIGNMILQFSEADGKPVFNGVRGIDNDLSFLLQDNTSSTRLGGTKAMKVVSEKSYNMLKALTPEMIQVMMKDLSFSENEIKCTLNRIENLKAAIDRKEIEVVKEGEWKNRHLMDLKGSSNYFEAIVDLKPTALFNNPNNNFLEAGRDDVFTKKEYESDIQKLHNIIDGLDETKRDQNEYKSFRAAVAMVEKLATELAENPNDLERGLTYQFALENLEKATKDYIDYKVKHLNGSRARNRLEAAKAMDKFIKDRIPEFKKKLHTATEKQMEKDMFEAKSKAMNFKLDSKDIEVRLEAARSELNNKPFKARTFATFKAISCLKEAGKVESTTEQQLENLIQKLEKSEAMIKLSHQLEGKEATLREMDAAFTHLLNPQEKVVKAEEKPQENVVVQKENEQVNAGGLHK